jgi:hypothetical protein
MMLTSFMPSGFCLASSLVEWLPAVWEGLGSIPGAGRLTQPTIHLGNYIM